MGLIIMLVFGIACAVIASAKGRSAVGWFFIGFFFCLVGLIILLVLSDLNKEQETLRQSQEEQRRLREQLLQEKMKSEAFRQHAALRFDAHDRALGMDTRATPALAGGDPGGLDAKLSALPFQPQPGPLAGPTPSDLIYGKVWYYELGGATVGPVTEKDVREMLGNGKLTRQSLLWAHAQGEWKPIARIAAFA